MLLSFCSGIEDATTYPDYRTFTSNQTGNTVFLALAACGLHRLDNVLVFAPANVATSLGGFLAGAWLAGQCAKRIGPDKRVWMLLSNFFQTCMVFAACALQYVYGVQEQGGKTRAVIVLLSLSSGAQLTLSRALGINEMSTAAATAAWADLMSDPNLLLDWKSWEHGRPRNRRLAFLLALVAGCFAGAGMYTKVSSAFALLICAIGKALAMVLFLFNKTEVEKIEHSTEEI